MRAETSASTPAAPPARPLPGAHAPTAGTAATGSLVALAGLSFVSDMLVAGNYGHFRDELYYMRVATISRPVTSTTGC
jgi:hypothetical protein